MLETFRLIAVVANMANPMHAPDIYILDTDLTQEDCAQGIAGGISAIDLPDGTSKPVPAATVLYCKLDPPGDASEPEFISTGPHTFRASWGDSQLSPAIDSADQERAVKPRKATKRKAKGK